MRNFTAGIRTTNGTINQAALEIIAPTDRGLRIVGMASIAMAAATASTFGIGRPAAKGITPTTPLQLQESNGLGVPSATTTALAWGTPPTLPSFYFHRITLPATIGAFINWEWPAEGIYVPKGTTLVVGNISATGVADISFSIVEDRA